jgi:galactokinase/mevalonate kinase-like predicted kinase
LVRLAEAADAELTEGSTVSLGAILRAAWQIKHTINSGVTNSIVGQACDAAMAAETDDARTAGVLRSRPLCAAQSARDSIPV